MNTERELVDAAAKLVMPFVCAIWAAKPQEFPLSSFFGNEDLSFEQAQAELEEILSVARADLPTLYDGEVATYLRGTSSVSRYLPSWLPLYQEAKALFESRHGVEHTRDMLYGLDRCASSNL